MKVFRLYVVVAAAILFAGTHTESLAQGSLSRLVVFRPNGSGVSVPCVIKVSGKNFGFVGNKRYIDLSIPSGRHSISAADSFRSSEHSLEALEVSFEEGETNYILCKRSPGLLPFGDFQITLSNKSTFENFRPKLKVQDQSKLSAHERK